MALERRVFVSMPADCWLEDHQNKLKWGIVDRIVKSGFVPEIFTNPRGMKGLSSGLAWSDENADRVMRRCVGAALIGVPRWKIDDGTRQYRFPTEYCHYEGAIARTLGLPTLIVAERQLVSRVVFDYMFSDFSARFDMTDGPEWLDCEEFRVAYGYWLGRIEERRDVFLGYCSTSTQTALALKAALEEHGATVLDWQTDFPPGRTILAEIEEAANRCTAGVFLFTRDDKLRGRNVLTAPRDNVVFEAGYFAAAKGPERALIILETGAKMPADLGGTIYLALDNRDDISPIKPRIHSFLTHRL